MRRRVAQRFISGQDVCLFCAFRPAYDVSIQSTRRSYATRDFHSSVRGRAPAGSAAARQDEDEDDPPMLRQNSDLLSTFPTRRQNVQPLPASRAQQHQPPPLRSERPHLSTRRDERTAQGEKLGFRNNFDGFARRDGTPQYRKPQDNRSDKKGHRSIFGNDESGRMLDRQPRRFDGRQPRQRIPQEGTPTFERPSSGVRRFVPSQGANDTELGSSESSRPPRGRVDQSQQRQQGQRGWQDESNIGRRVGSFMPFTEKPTRDTQTPQRTNGDRDLQRQKRGDADLAGRIGEANVSIETVEAPAEIPLETAEEFSVFHHRRGYREGKRESRSARFEEEDEASELEPSASTPSAQLQRAKAGMRPGNFDYDMAEAEEALFGERRRKKQKSKRRQTQEVAPLRQSIRISEFMSVGQLAKALGVQLEAFVARLEEEGFEGARYDHVLPSQDSSMIADLYGFDPLVAAGQTGIDLVARSLPEDVSTLPPRPPIVTIMGHVDHGKTTILDYLRKSSVVATEHGGITQHIGAFSVTMPGTNRQITFLDTPGHAAFLEMRRRGANVTDIVVLVVAADDSVKPQTIEAIKHAIEAKVQIIVAINKVDKEDANVERVKQDLTRHDIVVEDYGGDFQAVAVSGKTGQGMDELEEAIITLADVYDYRAEKDGLAEGTIIESKVTAAGRVATVLVRRGTLRTGDFIVAGNTWARVRTLRDDTGALVKEAPPGTPVQVDGWRGEDPTAGLEVLEAEDEQRAKDVVDFRIGQRENLRASMDMSVINVSRSEEAESRAKILEWEAQQEWARKSHGRRPKDNAGWVEPEAAGGPKQVHFVVKADVAGSVEAVVAAVAAVGNNEIVANVIHSGTGQVTESDIRILATTGETGYAISFNQPVDGTMYRLAEAAGLQILDHNIIYKVTDVVKDKLAKELPPIVTQKVLGEAEVGQIFEVTVKKNKIKIAGCKVTNGTISRVNKVRVSRGGSVVYTGTLHSLKNVKKDVTEMRKGTECGLGFENWDDFQEGDQIQCFEEHEEKRMLY